jgi:hypothetical protein
MSLTVVAKNTTVMWNVMSFGVVAFYVISYETATSICWIETQQCHARMLVQGTLLNRVTSHTTATFIPPNPHNHAGDNSVRQTQQYM